MMNKLMSYKQNTKKSMLTIAVIALAIILAGTLALNPIGKGDKVLAASAPIPINLIYYGSNTSSVTAAIIAAHPEFLVDNSPAGPWGGDANVSEYMAAGIKYFEYLDGGYEGTQARAIPNDLQSNLNYITAVAKEGAYGIFLDEVSDSPDAASISYLSAIYNAAHTLGLKVAFNTGVSSFSSVLMNYCDYMNSSETWGNNTLTSSQTTYGSRIWMETEGVTSASAAATLTEGAWNDGILAEYACGDYNDLPSWLSSYISLIAGTSPSTPVVSSPNITTTSLANGTVGTAYSQTLAATGGTAPYTWKISSGTLPAGLSFSTKGVISGTPTTACDPSVTFEVVDNNSMTAAESLAITINSMTVSTSTLSITTSALPSGTVGSAYSQTLSATGGTTPYSWTISSGTLPSGLTLSSSGVISGTPTTAIDPSVTFEVIGNNGSTATKALSITIGSAVAVTGSTTGNTTGVVESKGIATGATNEYDLYLKITSTTVSGVKVGQEVWLAATTTNFPNLLTVGATVTGNLNDSLGWWVLN
jgi:hypothetical protein